MGKSYEIAYLSEVGKLLRIFNRVYLTELFSVPTDTFNWTQGRWSGDTVIRRSYCVDLPNLNAIMEQAGSRYVLKQELFDGHDRSIWPLTCIPIHAVSKEAALLEKGELEIKGLNLIDPNIFVRRVIDLLHGHDSIFRYEITPDRYMAIYIASRQPSREQIDRTADEIKRKIVIEPLGLLEMERATWSDVRSPDPFSKTISIIRNDALEVTEQGWFFAVKFQIRPFRRGGEK